MLRTDHYIARDVADTTLLICATVPLNSCWVYELNSVGKLIWNICEDYNTIDDMIDKMDTYFQTPLTDAQKHSVKEYCQRIMEWGMIQ